MPNKLVSAFSAVVDMLLPVVNGRHRDVSQFLQFNALHVFEKLLDLPPLPDWGKVRIGLGKAWVVFLLKELSYHLFSLSGLQ